MGLTCRRLPCGRPGVLLKSAAADTLIAVRRPHEEWPLQSTGFALKAVLEGEREVRVEGRRYVLGPGRYLLLPPGSTLESGRTSERVAMLPVWFSPETVRSVAGDGPLPDEALLPRSPVLDRAVRRLWRFALRAESSGVPPGGTPELESLLLETLAAAFRASSLGERRLERLSSVRETTRREIVRRLSAAEDLLRGRFQSEVSLSDLSRASGMSAYHFLRRFAEYYGTTPHRFLTRLRLSHARRLLSEGGRSIKQVAYDCGYRSVPSFVHLCAREWGVTPAALARGERP